MVVSQQAWHSQSKSRSSLQFSFGTVDQASRPKRKPFLPLVRLSFIILSFWYSVFVQISHQLNLPTAPQRVDQAVGERRNP